jgi:hypothetical protein
MSPSGSTAPAQHSICYKGIHDESANVITDTGEWSDPTTGGTIGVRAVTKLVSKDEFVYEMYMIGPDGKEFKTLEN